MTLPRGAQANVAPRKLETAGRTAGVARRRAAPIVCESDRLRTSQGSLFDLAPVAAGVFFCRASETYTLWKVLLDLILLAC